MNIKINFDSYLELEKIAKLSVVPDILYTPTVIEQNTWSHIAAVYNKNTNSHLNLRLINFDLSS